MAKKKLKDHVKQRKSTKIKLYYHKDGYRDLEGNIYSHDTGIKLLQENKATLPTWKHGKKAKTTYEGVQYTGGREKGRKNLIKLDNGNFQNEHGVVFTPAERKALESQVNTANRKRMKMLEEEGNLPRLVGGKETGDSVRSLQLMGKESDFILSRKSKSLQRFKSRADYDRYMSNLQKVNSPSYVDDRVRMYKRNHMTALENVFGDDAKDIVMKIRMMKPADYMKLIQSDEDLEINYIYDPSALQGKLNQIRVALGIKTKEEPI